MELRYWGSFFRGVFFLFFKTCLTRNARPRRRSRYRWLAVDVLLRRLTDRRLVSIGLDTTESVRLDCHRVRSTGPDGVHWTGLGVTGSLGKEIMKIIIGVPPPVPRVRGLFHHESPEQFLDLLVGKPKL